MTTQPSFKTTPEEFSTIHQIVRRAITDGLLIDRDRMSAMMDIGAAHNSNPLDLDAWLKADATNFTHDLCGIRRHINRNTGELEDFFSPRFSKR